MRGDDSPDRRRVVMSKVATYWLASMVDRKRARQYLKTTYGVKGSAFCSNNNVVYAQIDSDGTGAPIAEILENGEVKVIHEWLKVAVEYQNPCNCPKCHQKMSYSPYIDMYFCDNVDCSQRQPYRYTDEYGFQEEDLY
jgi:hypothetical protein